MPTRWVYGSSFLRGSYNNADPLGLCCSFLRGSYNNAEPLGLRFFFLRACYNNFDPPGLSLLKITTKCLNKQATSKEPRRGEIIITRH